MKRMGMVIGIKPDRIAEYKRTHAAVWPAVLAKISDCNIQNYTIFLREPENLLFAYFEYHGRDWAADAAKMAGRSAHAGVVGDPRADAGAARLPQVRRVVGDGRGSFSYRLTRGGEDERDGQVLSRGYGTGNAHGIVSGCRPYWPTSKNIRECRLRRLDCDRL